MQFLSSNKQILKEFLKEKKYSQLSLELYILFFGSFSLILFFIFGIALDISILFRILFALFHFVIFFLLYRFFSKSRSEKLELAARFKKINQQMKLLYLKTTESFNQFVPKEYLTLLKKKQMWEIKLGDHVSRDMTVLFADIRSFTSMAEKVSAKEIFEFLNQFYSQMNLIIEKHNGIIDKYIGDALLAIFPNSVDDAINCAVEMQLYIRERVFRINNNDKKIEIGIGIHYGEVLLGVLGSEKRMQTTVISDVVNTASRLESLSKSYGAPIIISAEVIQNVVNLDKYHIRFLDNAFIRGKEEQTFICEVYNIDYPEQIELKDKTKHQFDNGVIIYQSGEYQKAWEIFLQILTINPRDKAAMFFLNRTATFLVEGIKITPEAKVDYVVWEDAWNTDIDVVDYQHKVLFSVINDLERAIQFNIEREALKRIISNLKIYTYTHFTMEEELMLMASYPDFSDHKLEHKKFIDKIESVEEELKTGTSNVGKKTLEFLFFWLKSHILKSDKDGYAPLVKEVMINQKKI